MDMMFAPLRKYADFYGRATRTEFWMFCLFRVLLFIAFVVVIGVIAALDNAYGTGPDGKGGPYAIGAGVVFTIGILVYLGLLLPELAVTVRRLHDQDLSGWLVLLNLVPMGGFVLFIFMLLKGTAGTNRHGPDPRTPIEATANIFV